MGEFENELLAAVIEAEMAEIDAELQRDLDIIDSRYRQCNESNNPQKS